MADVPSIAYSLTKYTIYSDSRKDALDGGDLLLGTGMSHRSYIFYSSPDQAETVTITKVQVGQARTQSAFLYFSKPLQTRFRTIMHTNCSSQIKNPFRCSPRV